MRVIVNGPLGQIISFGVDEVNVRDNGALILRTGPLNKKGQIFAAGQWNFVDWEEEEAK